MASNQYESSNDAEGMMPMETFSHTKKNNFRDEIEMKLFWQTYLVYATFKSSCLR